MAVSRTTKMSVDKFCCVSAT